MSLHVKNAGAWAAVQDLYIRQSGVWVPVQQAFVKNAGAWVEYYAAEVVVTIAANSTNVNLSTLFTAGDWTSTKKKRVVVQSGVVIGSTAPGTPAMRTGTGWGGVLTLDNAGTIQGAGGVLNSGVGGGALLADSSGLVVNNTGTIRSGGGGGGQGGAGTATTYINRDPATGQRYLLDFGSGPNWNWIDGVQAGMATDEIFWNSTSRVATPPKGSSQFDSGGFRYFKGTRDGGTAFYGVYRFTISSGPTVGGDGGRGQGHDGAAAAGAAGGTSAGTGGAGGAYGASGATGAAGNNGSGVAGGLAGISYNAANIAMNNSGTILGRTV